MSAVFRLWTTGFIPVCFADKALFRRLRNEATHAVEVLTLKPGDYCVTVADRPIGHFLFRRV